MINLLDVYTYRKNSQKVLIVQTKIMIKQLSITLLFFYLLFCKSFSYAQVNEARYRYGYHSLNSFLGQSFGEVIRNSRDSLNICITSITMASFIIDTTGNIAKLTFYEDNNNPKIFRTILEKVLYATNGLWQTRSVNGKLEESNLFLLPFIYDLEANCYENVIRNQTKKAKSIKKSKQIGTQLGILKLLDFEGKKLDCTILQPLQYSTIN